MIPWRIPPEDPPGGSPGGPPRGSPQRIPRKIPWRIPRRIPPRIPKMIPHVPPRMKICISFRFCYEIDTENMQFLDLFSEIDPETMLDRSGLKKYSNPYWFKPNRMAGTRVTAISCVGVTYCSGVYPAGNRAVVPRTGVCQEWGLRLPLLSGAVGY